MHGDGTPTDRFVGRTLNGRFRISKRLGRGGMGTVYLAEQISVGRTVAVKLLHGDFAADDEFVARFRDEARAAAAVRHRNVVVVHDYDRDGEGNLFIAMELLEGAHLGEVLQRAGPLRMDQAVELGLQIAEGLRAAHRAGVIHRDVKPPNIMLVEGGAEVKLMDFGIARLRQMEAAHLTAPGTMLGTPKYMAPEQIEGGVVSDATDIYAFGIVLYEMLTGTVPFTGPTIDVILAKHLRERPLPPSHFRHDVPAALDAVVMKALEKRPDDRQRDMAQVIDGLRLVKTALGGGTRLPREIDEPTRTAAHSVPAATASASSPLSRAVGPTSSRSGGSPRRLIAVVTTISSVLLVAVLAWTAYPRSPTPSVQLPVAPRPSASVAPGTSETPGPVRQAVESTRPLAPAPATLPPRDPTSSGPMSADERTKELVEERLRGGGLLTSSSSDRGVSVAVAGGGRIVTLTGVLRDERERQDMLRLTKEVPGIIEVRERINIRESWSRSKR
jgi:serine/threonine-protein kinase